MSQLILTRAREIALYLALSLMLAIATSPQLPNCTQGACGDGICEAGESMHVCPQDCGILLVNEDFEDGQVQGWNFDPAAWEITVEGDTHVWRTTQQTYASTSGARDIAWFLRARRVNSDANLYFRTAWPNNYALHLQDTRLVLWTERDGFPQDLTSANLDIGATWHDFRIDAVGRQITVTVDGSVALTYTDGLSASLRGGISLEAYDDDGARFDDIRLYSVTPQCYDGARNGDETGVDCGGSCPNQDCCANRAWDADLGEGGVDCDGGCMLTCQPADRLDRWTQTNGPWLEYIKRIRFDPDDPQTILAASNTGSGVVKSTDGGRTWQEISDGISPMNVFGLALDPTDKNTIYAGTANGRVYVTSDGGDSWQLLWQYTEVDDAIWTLEVDPTDRDRLFAGTGDYTGCDGRIYRSKDRGQTWDKVLDVDPANNWDHGFISSLTFDPVTPTTVYATSGIGDWCGGGNPGDPNPVGFGIYKSLDSGDTWTPINTGLEDLTVSHLVVDPTNTQTLYAAVGCVDDAIALPGNVFKSTDGGAHWQRLDGVSPIQPVTRLALHPDEPQKVYAMGYAGIFLSEDGGAHWSRLDESFKAAVYSFFYEHAFVPGDPQTMIVGTYSGGIIKSVDGGRNWFEVDGLRHQGDVLGNSYGTALDPTDPDTLYATTIGGIFKTANGGESWRFIGQGVFQHLRQIAIDPTDPQRLYLGGDSQTFYISDDGGDTWTQVSLSSAARNQVTLLPPGADVQFPAIAVDPFSPNRVLVAVYRAPDTPLLRSTDYGQTWHTPSLGFQAASYALAFHPTISGTVYAGLGWQPGQPRLLRSEDGGATWTDAAPGLNLLTVYQMVEANGIIRAATNGSGVQTRWPGDPVVWESTSYVAPGNWLSYITRLATDGGDPASFLAFDKGDRTVYRLAAGSPWRAALSLIASGDEVFDLAYDPADSHLAYATTRLSGLWRSADGGATWSPANTGLPVSATLRGLAVGPTGDLYVGQTGAPGRLYTSADGGDHWGPLNDALTFNSIHAFAADPTDPNVAYAGVWGGGTWKTEDGGASWALLPEAPVSAAALVVDPDDPQTVYATDRTAPTLWQSADGGQHWWRRFDAGSAYSRLQALALDPHHPDTVYVSAFKPGGYGADGSLFRVTRAGYTDVTGSLPRVVISLGVSPDQPGLLLASTHIYGLYRSTDDGQTWQVVEDELPRVGFNAMAWDPGSGALWGGACSGSFPDYLRPPGLPDGDNEPGLYRSTDDGLTWTHMLTGVVGKGFAFDGGAIYAAADNSVYLSTDGGETWTPQSGGPPLGYSAVAIGDGQLYVGTLGGGVYSATIAANHALTWQGTSGPTAEIHAIQLTSVSGLTGTLFATAFPGGVYKSTDGGASWQEANFGLPGFTLPDPARNGYYALAVNPANPQNLYLGIYGYGVYRSDDGAATWLPANTGLGNRYVYSLLIEANGDYIWASTNDGMQSLWRSSTGTSGRLSWSPAPDAPPSFQAITGIEINPEKPDEITVTAFPAGVFSTPDGGAHWYERSNNLYVGKQRTHGVGFEDGYYQLAQDPLNPRHLFYGTYTGQVYETRDGGQSWMAFDDGLMREGSIYAFEVASDGARMYVSQKAGGVSRRALDPTAPQTRVITGEGTPCARSDHLYTTVGAALTAANPGDVILVCPGQYAESVTVTQAVRLEAFAGPSRTILDAASITAGGARLAGFRLHALSVSGDDVLLLGNVVYGRSVFLPLVLR